MVIPRLDSKTWLKTAYIPSLTTDSEPQVGLGERGRSGVSRFTRTASPGSISSPAHSTSWAETAHRKTSQKPPWRVYVCDAPEAGSGEVNTPWTRG